MGCIFAKQENKKQIDRLILEQSTYETTDLPTYNFTEAKVIKVYDGDTFWISAWYNNNLCRFKVRLYGVDCPELRGTKGKEKEKALEAKKFVMDTVLDKLVNITVLNNKKVCNKKITEKYGRLLAKVYPNGFHYPDLSTMLIKQGLAKEYYGGTK
jgi:endonuclease YncB( thermonuclease family)